MHKRCLKLNRKQALQSRLIAGCTKTIFGLVCLIGLLGLGYVELGNKFAFPDSLEVKHEILY